MVQIPNYQAQVDLETPNYPRVQVDNSVGEGLTRAGSAAMAAGSQLGDIAVWQRRRHQQEMRRYGFEVSSSVLTAEEIRPQLEALRGGEIASAEVQSLLAAAGLTRNEVLGLINGGGACRPANLIPGKACR